MFAIPVHIQSCFHFILTGFTNKRWLIRISAPINDFKYLGAVLFVTVLFKSYHRFKIFTTWMDFLAYTLFLNWNPFSAEQLCGFFFYLLPVFLCLQRWHNKGRLYFCRLQARMFLYHFLHAFSWFLQPWCYGARVILTMKHLYVYFAVLYIAPCSTRCKFTRISSCWTVLFVVRPVFKLSRVCHTELDTKRTLYWCTEKSPYNLNTASLLFCPLRDFTFPPFPHYPRAVRS